MGVQEFDFSTGKVLNSNRKQALVLSDCDIASDLLEGRIRNNHYKFLGKTSELRQALEWIRKFKIGVLFLDADLNNVEAIPLLEVLKKKAPDFSVILMTETPTKELLSQGQIIGAAGFLVKPLEADNIDKAIERIK